MDFPGLSTEDKPLWGCMFMDKSKNILETNQDVWYLDLTHRVSRDFGKRMKTVLFTYTLWWHVIKLLEWEYLVLFITNTLKEDPIILFWDFLSCIQ